MKNTTKQLKVQNKASALSITTKPPFSTETLYFK